MNELINDINTETGMELEPVLPDRLHNSEVGCAGGNCDKCGWNPEVDAVRKAALRPEKEAVQNG